MRISNYHLGTLKQEFEQLYKIEDPKKRGKELENFIWKIFEFSGYNSLKTDKLTKYGEQIDIHAHKDRMNVLVECKWHTKKIGLREIESFAFRIHKRDPTTIGLFIAVNGVSEPAKEFSIHIRDRLLLFLDEIEIKELLSTGLDLELLLETKIRYLQRGEIFLLKRTIEKKKFSIPIEFNSYGGLFSTTDPDYLVTNFNKKIYTVKLPFFHRLDV